MWSKIMASVGFVEIEDWSSFHLYVNGIDDWGKHFFLMMVFGDVFLMLVNPLPRTKFLFFDEMITHVMPLLYLTENGNIHQFHVRFFFTCISSSF